MTPALNVTINAWHNSRYDEAFYLIGENGPVDISGRTAKMHIRQYGAAGGSPLITLPNVTFGSQGVFIFDPVNGALQIRVDEATLTGVYTSNSAGLEAGSPLKLRHDLVLSLSGGGDEIWFEGDFIINAGVTL